MQDFARGRLCATSRFRSRRPRSRPCKKFKHAANATATVSSGIRCDKKTRHRSYFVLSSFLRSSWSGDSRRKEGTGAKTSFSRETKPATSLFELEQANVARVGLPYFGRTDQPVSFMNIILDGGRARHRRLFISRIYFSRPRSKVPKNAEVLHVRPSTLTIGSTARSFSLHF